MAEALIESLSADFDPTSYRDEYREQLLSLIERKAEGKEIVTPEAAEPEATKAPDLMAALEESIAAVQERARRQGQSRLQAQGGERQGGGETETLRARQSQSLEIAWPRTAWSRSTGGS